MPLRVIEEKGEREGIFVHHLHGVQAAHVFFFVVELAVGSAEAAEVDGTDATKEVEVAEGEGGLAVERGGVGGETAKTRAANAFYCSSSFAASNSESPGDDYNFWFWVKF